MVLGAEVYGVNASGVGAPRQLATVDQRTEYARAAGIDEVIVMVFTAALASTTAEDFAIESWSIGSGVVHRAELPVRPRQQGRRRAPG